MSVVDDRLLDLRFRRRAATPAAPKTDVEPTIASAGGCGRCFRVSSTET